MKFNNPKPVQIFLIAVIFSLGGIYCLCDYYLQSIAHELMLNWVRNESALIQEGNLLTSSTKNQRFLLSSDYIQAIKLIRIKENQISERLHFGKSFDIKENDIPLIDSEITLKRVGFLHSRAFYQIPNRKEMLMVFDIESKVLNAVFFGGSLFLLLMVIVLDMTIRFIKEQEFKKREDLFRQALNDFISKDTPSKMVEDSLPTLMSWWKDKKEQVALAHDLAISNQRKIILGEIAARVGHDIIGSVRNAEILSKRTQWHSESQKTMFTDSLQKIRSIVNEISLYSKSTNLDENNIINIDHKYDLLKELQKIIKRKQIQYESQFKILYENLSLKNELYVNFSSLELERTLSNLINNAIEASQNGSTILINSKLDSEMIKIEIIDSGKGISPNIINKIGTKHFTFDKKNGTGIGFFYAKQFVEKLGGQIIIESVLNKGTKICLNIPIFHVIEENNITYVECKNIIK